MIYEDKYLKESSPNSSTRRALMREASKSKKDEFYTRYVDIEKEIKTYTDYDSDVFKDSKVICPCDDYRVSNFSKFFRDNAETLGIREVVSTCWPDGLMERFYYDGTCWVSEVSELEGDGDILSQEVKYLIDEADFVITNPPFSLFKKIYPMIKHKKFSLVGNINAVTFKDVYPDIVSGSLSTGESIKGGVTYFDVHESYDISKATKLLDEDGKTLVGLVSVRWFTNIGHNIRREVTCIPMDENIKTKNKVSNNPKSYIKYANSDAINIPYTDAIPSDYSGSMGVPITFLDKYDPDKFDIIAIKKGDDGRDFIFEDGTTPYCRVIIKHKN